MPRAACAVDRPLLVQDARKGRPWTRRLGLPSGLARGRGRCWLSLLPLFLLRLRPLAFLPIRIRVHQGFQPVCHCVPEFAYQTRKQVRNWVGYGRQALLQRDQKGLEQRNYGLKQMAHRLQQRLQGLAQPFDSLPQGLDSLLHSLLER